MKKLKTPKELKQEIPSSVFQNRIQLHRENVKRILKKEDGRLLVIVGPCSIHDKKSALAYASFIKDARDMYGSELEIVMRTYFEKPRTSVGWKGFTYDPDLNGSNDIEKGLTESRKLLHEITDSYEVPCATEFLNTLASQYISDFIVYGVIGARTSESQVHREFMSEQKFPMGVKNSVSGSLSSAVNAVKASSSNQNFISIGEDGDFFSVTNNGNDSSHIVLRGGENGPNYERGSVNLAKGELEGVNGKTGLVVDSSHANSGKDHRNQIKVVRDICEQISEGEDSIVGVMIESNVVEGNQSISNNLVFGKSITDSCVSIEETEEMFKHLKDAVLKRKR